MVKLQEKNIYIEILKRIYFERVLTKPSTG